RRCQRSAATRRPHAAAGQSAWSRCEYLCGRGAAGKSLGLAAHAIRGTCVPARRCRQSVLHVGGVTNVAGIWWLASYPKSGNTWLRIVLATLLADQDIDINALGFLGAISSNRFAFDDALGISSGDLSLEQETVLRPRAYELWAAEAGRRP